MMAYKMVNTLDSMIAYKDDRFKDFGLVAARIDDLANIVPARLTALIMVLLTFNVKAFIYIFKYGNKHSSPNSGYPEAALAGILNCRFGGSNIYHGKLVEKPYIGKNERIITTPQGSIIKTYNNAEVVNMCANNYLGLSNNQDLIAAAKSALDKYGFGL